MKVVTLVGTRPELIKLCLTIAELDRHIEHVLVHSGQNFDYELNELFFKELGIRSPDYYLDVAGNSVVQTIARVIERFDAVLETEQPDAVLLLGDTNSCLAVIAAKRRKIPIFHMEAGNRCFDARVPEEINRKLVDHTSDINLTYTEHARRYLLSEGLRAETVIKTGSPMREILEHFAPGIRSSDALTRLGVHSDQYFLVSAHREENVDQSNRLEALLDVLDSLVLEHNFPVLFSTHPRTSTQLKKLGVNMDTGGAIRFLKPLGFLDYCALQENAFCTLSDSGTLTEESSILGFPAVMIRDAHERPEGMDEASLIMCGLNKERVLDAVRVVRAHHANAHLHPPRDYEPDNVSTKVLRIILSHVDFVNRTTWYKPTVSV